MRRTRFAIGRWQKEILPRIARHHEEHLIDREEVPFVMSRDPDLLRIGPSSRTEWSLFTARMMITLKRRLTCKAVGDFWREHLLGPDMTVLSGVAERSALINLQRGLSPPATGLDNPHFYDDGAVARAVAVGIAYSGEPEGAAEAARLEASVSHSEDGVWAAQVMAATVAGLCGGASAGDAVEAAVKYLPEDSWIGRTWDRCQKIVGGSNDIFSSIPELDQYVVDKVYSYAHLAPQTLPVALAFFMRSQGDFIAEVSAANCLARLSDSVPCFLGALVGAYSGIDGIPVNWQRGMAPVGGFFVPTEANASLDEVARNLIDCAK